MFCGILKKLFCTPLSHYVHFGEKRGSMFIILPLRYACVFHATEEMISLNRAQQEQRNGASFMIGCACPNLKYGFFTPLAVLSRIRSPATSFEETTSSREMRIRV